MLRNNWIQISVLIEFIILIDCLVFIGEFISSFVVNSVGIESGKVFGVEFKSKLSKSIKFDIVYSKKSKQTNLSKGKKRKLF